MTGVLNARVDRQHLKDEDGTRFAHSRTQTDEARMVVRLGEAWASVRQ